MAALAVDPENSDDQSLFASLLRRAWDAGGYHPRLQILQAAKFFGGSDEPHGSKILEVVQSLESNHWALQSLIVEVLAGFGEIDLDITADELQADIRVVISHPQDPDYWTRASAVVSNRFENEEIVGPYSEAIDGLDPDERIRLFAMAARGADPAMSTHLSWTLERLQDLAPTGDQELDIHVKAIFALFLDGPPADSVIPTESMATCVAAIRGWAKFETTLPPATASRAPDQAAWPLVARLIFRYERNDALRDPETTWQELTADRHLAIEALAWLDTAASATPWSSHAGTAATTSTAAGSTSPTTARPVTPSCDPTGPAVAPPASRGASTRPAPAPAATGSAEPIAR